MNITRYLRRVQISFNPLRYKEIADEPWDIAAYHIPITVGVGFLLLVLLLVPTLMGMTDSIETQMTTFTEFTINGKVSMGEPVELPQYNPKFVVDLNSNERITTEKVRVTRNYIYVNVFGGAKQVPMSKILAPLANRRDFAQAFFLLAIFALPSLIFYGYVALLLKYAVVVGIVSGLALFTAHVLLLVDVSSRRLAILCIYAATPMIFLETIVGPLYGKLLVPITDVFGVTINAVSLGLYIGLVIAGVAFVETKHMHEDSARWNF